MSLCTCGHRKDQHAKDGTSFCYETDKCTAFVAQDAQKSYDHQPRFCNYFVCHGWRWGAKGKCPYVANPKYRPAPEEDIRQRLRNILSDHRSFAFEHATSGGMHNTEDTIDAILEALGVRLEDLLSEGKQ